MNNHKRAIMRRRVIHKIQYLRFKRDIDGDGNWVKDIPFPSAQIYIHSITFDRIENRNGFLYMEDGTPYDSDVMAEKIARQQTSDGVLDADTIE